MGESQLTSVRWPWLRGGWMGGLALLSPLVWVVETSSCQTPARTREITGAAMMSQWELGQWVGVLGMLGVVVLTPYLARGVQPGLRWAIHLCGLLGTAFMLYGVTLGLFFTIFATRVVRAAGWVVMASALMAFTDSVARLALGTREWWRARRGDRSI